MPIKQPVNEIIFDEITKHSVDLLRFEGGERLRIIEQLNTLEADIMSLVTKYDPVSPRVSKRRMDRLEKLLDQVQDTIATAYGVIVDDQGEMLQELADLESEFAQEVLTLSIPVEVETVALAPKMIKEISRDTLIDGAASSEWWKKQETGLLDRFSRSVRQGMYEGESIGQLVDRIAGTQAQNFTDGVMEVTRRNAEALVRTSVQTVANQARTATWQENEDLIKGLKWVSTLDGRTTPQCIARDGHVYDIETFKPLDGGPPWGPGPGGGLHWNCRSTSIPVVKSWRELGIDLDEAPKGTRASMNGQVPADTTYEEWLKDKPEEFQNDVLGVGKAKLWREGKIGFTDLLDQRGNPLSLKQLREKLRTKG